jgi:hypothetical protein
MDENIQTITDVINLELISNLLLYLTMGGNALRHKEING